MRESEDARPFPLGYSVPARLQGSTRTRWTGVFTVRRALRAMLGFCAAALPLAYLGAATCGSGTRGYFSPDTLEYRTQTEWLLPLTRIPLYHGPSSVERYPAVDYLIAEGYWSPAATPDPRWLPVVQWNQQWRDGHSEFHGSLRMRGHGWVEWSKRNRGIANVLWPRVLEALRRPGGTNLREAEDLMAAAQNAESVAEFEEIAAEFEKHRGR